MRATKKQRSAERRRRFYHERVAAAASPSDRLSRALDYLRARLTHAPAHEQERIANALTSQILRAADTVKEGLE